MVSASKGQYENRVTYSIPGPHSDQDALVDQALEERTRVAAPATALLEVVRHVDVVLRVRRRCGADLGRDGRVGEVRGGGQVRLVRVDVVRIVAADECIVEILRGCEAGVPTDEFVVRIVVVAVLELLLDARVVGRVP